MKGYFAADDLFIIHELAWFRFHGIIIDDNWIADANFSGIHKGHSFLVISRIAEDGLRQGHGCFTVESSGTLLDNVFPPALTEITVKTTIVKLRNESYTISISWS